MLFACLDTVIFILTLWEIKGDTMKRSKISVAFGIMMIALAGLIVATPTKEADAQVVLGAYCCDGGGVRRCVIGLTPIGNACFCYGQGWGVACG